MLLLLFNIKMLLLETKNDISSISIKSLKVYVVMLYYALVFVLIYDQKIICVLT